MPKLGNYAGLFKFVNSDSGGKVFVFPDSRAVVALRLRKDDFH